MEASEAVGTVDGDLDALDIMASLVAQSLEGFTTLYAQLSAAIG